MEWLEIWAAFKVFEQVGGYVIGGSIFLIFIIMTIRESSKK